MPLSRASLPDVIERRRMRESWRKIAEAHGVAFETLGRWVRQQPDFPAELLEPLPKPKRVVSDEDLRWMIEDEGMTDDAIAQQLKMKVSSFRRLRTRRGFHRGEPGATRALTPEMLKEADRLLDEGYSYAAVHEFTGIGFRSLRTHFPGRGFTREESIQAALMGRRLADLKPVAQ